MTTYAFPTLTREFPSRFEWRSIAPTQYSRSSLSGQVQSQGLPGQRWAFAATWEALQGTDAAALQAFLVKLRGFGNRFTFYNAGQPAPRGTLSGTVLVNGGSQTGASLICDGAGAGTTLLTGEMLGFNGELHMLAADATADGSGNITFTLSYPMRASPANNAPVTYLRPTGTFMLLSQSVGWNVYAPSLSDISIEAEETFSV